jgi:SPP1 gp7 family putative phage head morphogenesis protein
VDGLTQALVEGVALGYNPRKTAQIMASGLSDGLNKALVIARTEQLRTYRAANLEQYQNMGIQQWQRHCAFSDRTCVACLGLDGKIYPTNTGFASHPNCRCFMTAVIPGEPITETNAQKWFGGLDEDRKKEILGKGHYELYQKGVPLSEMVSVNEDPIWGPTIGIRSLKDIDPTWSKAYKTNLGQEVSTRLRNIQTTRKQSQQIRIAEIGSMGDKEITQFLQRTEIRRDLPKPVYHFNKHGIEMGFSSKSEYLNSYKEFIERKDLRIFTFIDSKTKDRMWYKADLDTGFIAQYNETQNKPWSYFHQKSLRRSFSQRSDIIEVISNGKNWEIMKWNSQK